jgi:hypothetical protein
MCEHASMAAVVVVQSDELAVWTGLVGALGGVALGACLDWWRSRVAERKRTRTELLRAASQVVTSAQASVRASAVAGDSKDEAAWVEILETRSAAMNAALLTIRVIGNKNLEMAAMDLLGVALKPMPPFDIQGPHRERLHEISEKLRVFRDIAQAAKL